MSVLLYRLGRVIAAHRGLVIGGWLLVLGSLLGSSLTLGTHYDDAFSIPGTQSQQGQDLLLDRFDQTGTTAQVVLTADTGRVTAKTNAAAVATVAKAIDGVRHVSMANPLDATDPVVSADGGSTLGQVLFAQAIPSERTLDQVQEAAEPGNGVALTTSVGGDAYKATGDPSKVPELLGLLVSFLILCITFGSLITAGMPILTALVGVGVTLSAVVVVSSAVTVSSTSPTLAEMLGLAVGIDYALFILSRYRRQLGDDVAPGEAMARALATAGSAVVFAGSTVVIALTGLAVARIPVLTVMGLAAAAAVTVAVLVALTLLPAIALLFGTRLRPRRRHAEASAADGRPGERPGGRRRWRPRLRRRRSAPPGPRVGVPTRWVRLVTRLPALTILVVTGTLLVVAVPAASLELALPDNSTAPENTPQRTTYDDITRTFGEGYNAPLSVTAGVITSNDPVGTVNKLATGIGKVKGVVAVTQATPNQGGDTALIQVIPERGQTAPSTAALVNRLRAQSSALEKQYGVTNLMVTGPTAINIDVSDRLAGALLPFAAIVIGLSLLLLMVVFRSIAVPLKATLGYLLSVGAALGAVVAVFQWGWAESLVPGLADGPIVSFLPIFVMGVLFGLAMDYEMFLVSAMREEFVAHGDPRRAVLQGFRASSVVVTAAALIMTSVFVAFIPGGSSTIKPIAFGLAVGVFVDAFIVRMTLVPAVLVLLGRHAWWLPSWLERRVPAVDVEGAALHRRVAFQQWEADRGATALLAQQLMVAPEVPPLTVTAPPGELTTVAVPGGLTPADLGQVLVGRRRAVGGELVVDGLLLPEQAAGVQRATALVLVGTPPADPPSAEARIEERARVSTRSRAGRTAFAAAAEEALGRLEGHLARAGADGAPAVRRALRAALVEAALDVAGGARILVVGPRDMVDAVHGAAAAQLAGALAAEGVTVLSLAADEPGRRHAEVEATLGTDVLEVVHDGDRREQQALAAGGARRAGPAPPGGDHPGVVDDGT